MKWDFALSPKWVDPLKHYSRPDAFQAGAAGVTAGMVAVPPAVTWPIATGMKPQAGPAKP